MAKFEKGKSGNPKGRPKGLLNKKTLVAQSLIEDTDFKDIIETLAVNAKEGCHASANILLARLWPPLRPVDAPVSFTVGDSLASTAMEIVKAMSKGDIAPNVGNAVLAALSNTVKALELAEIQKRLDALEQGKEVA